MESYVVRARRQLHMYPEIGFDLPKTLEFLRSELDTIGVEYTEKYGKSSIVATVNPEKTHFTIGVRADTDALPIKEENDVPYKSKIDGQMHACGHDSHTAIALATLKEIYEMRDKINCRVKFIFQSAEEYSPSGAKLMAEDGVMDDIDCAVALHCDAAFNVGQIGVSSGPINATSDGFLLEFFGKSAHVAAQQKGVDAIMMAVRAYTDIQFVVSKEVSAKSPVIFNVGSIHGGVANNIICDYAYMYCTLRTHTDDVANHVLDKVKRIINAVAETAGGTAKFTQKKHYPIVVNDEKIAELVRNAAISVVGADKVFPKRRGMGGEDFSYFANEKPSCMYYLGVRNTEKDCVYDVHTPKFNLDEDALDIGVKIFKQFIIDNMNGIK